MTQEQLNDVNKALNSMGIENIQNIILINNGATVGDVINFMFPNLEVEIEGNYVTCWIDEHRWVGLDLSLWNAPYKKEVKE